MSLVERICAVSCTLVVVASIVFMIYVKACCGSPERPNVEANFKAERVIDRHYCSPAKTDIEQYLETNETAVAKALLKQLRERPQVYCAYTSLVNRCFLNCDVQCPACGVKFSGECEISKLVIDWREEATRAYNSGLRDGMRIGGRK